MRLWGDCSGRAVFASLWALFIITVAVVITSGGSYAWKQRWWWWLLMVIISSVLCFYWQLANMERIADEVKSALKPFFVRNEIDKEEYKDVMRKAVPKVSTDLVCLLLWFFNNYRLNTSVVKKNQHFCHCRKTMRWIANGWHFLEWTQCPLSPCKFWGRSNYVCML